jgi:hypothetical protein
MKKTLVLILLFNLLNAEGFIQTSPSLIGGTQKEYHPGLHSKGGDEYLPIYKDTCTNNAHNGEIEGQAIEIMRQTRDFIEHITNQKEYAKKMDRINFMAAYTKCLKINMQQEFGDCKTNVGDSSQDSTSGISAVGKADTGKTCIIDQFLEGIGEEDKILSITSGEETSDVSGNPTGKTQNHIDLDAEKMITSLNLLLEGKYADGWYDQIQACLGYEKLKIQVFIQEELIRNFNIVNSMVRSINTTCLPPLRNSAEAVSWTEVFVSGVANVANASGEQVDIQKLIKDTSSGNTVELEENIKTHNLDFCIDGYGKEGCISERKKLDLQTKVSLEENQKITQMIDTPENNTFLKYITSEAQKKTSERYRIQYKDKDQLSKVAQVWKEDKIWTQDVIDIPTSLSGTVYQRLKWIDMINKQRYNLKEGSELRTEVDRVIGEVFNNRIWVDTGSFIIGESDFPEGYVDSTLISLSTVGYEWQLLFIEEETKSKFFIETEDRGLIRFLRGMIISKLNLDGYNKYTKTKIVPKDFKGNVYDNEIIKKIEQVNKDTKNQGFNLDKNADFRLAVQNEGRQLLYEHIKEQYNRSLLARYHEVEKEKVLRVVNIPLDLDKKVRRVKEAVNLKWNLGYETRTGRLVMLYLDSVLDYVSGGAVSAGIKYVSDRIEDIGDQSQGLIISDTVRGLNGLTMKLNAIEQKYQN